MNIQIIIPLLIYLTIIFGFAYINYKKYKSNNKDFISEYLLGSRSMGGFLLAMTTAATYTGASSFIGGPGAAYKYGLGWVLLAMIQVPAVWFSLGILGKKFANLARSTKSLTINDILYSRYQNKLLMVIASIALVLSFFAGIVVQFIGAARLLESSIGINYNLALILFALTIAAYTFIGGFRAVVITDSIQGIIMVIGTILLLACTIYYIGGIDIAMEKLAVIDPKLLSPYGSGDILTAPFMASFWILVCFGLVGLPHTAIRAMAYKDSNALHKGMLIGTAVIAILMFGMHLSGVLGRVVISDLAIPDQVIPKLMVVVMPPIIAGIFLAAPMAAIMSSIDSQLIQASSVFIKDIFLNNKPSLNKPNNTKKVKLISNLSTLIFTILAIIVALNPPDMIIWLNLFALGGLEASFLWVIVLGLFWSRANVYGAVSSMLLGLISYILLYQFNIRPFTLHPIVLALSIGFISFIIANYCGELYMLAKTKHKIKIAKNKNLANLNK